MESTWLPHRWVQRWKKRWLKLSAIGLESETIDAETRGTYFANRLTGSVFLLTAIYLPVYWHFELFAAIAFDVLCMGMWVGVLLLHHKKRFDEGKYLAVFTGCFQISGLAYLLGEGSYLSLYFYPASFVPFFLFTKKENRQLVVTYLLLAVCVVFERFTVAYEISYYSVLPEELLPFIYNLNFCGALLFGVLFASFFRALYHKQERGLETAYEAAQAAAESKSQFLSIMSHEIRTPLNGITGISSILLDDIKEPEHQKQLKALKQSGNYLLNLVNDILDFNKMEAGKLRLDSIAFNLPQLVTSVRDMYTYNARERGISFFVQYDSDLPTSLLGDPVRLGQVLANLVHNAIKFTDHGEVVLSVKQLSREGQEVELLFEVKDTGLGIKEEYLEQLTDTFVQAGPDIGQRFGGTGLGLAIVKKLLALYSSELRVVSEPNVGSSFSFQLKLAMTPTQLEPTVPGESKESLSGKRILVVDDNEVNLMVASKFLQKKGAEPVKAASGAAALEQLNKPEAAFDLVLLDLIMPEMDGYEVAKSIRASGQLHIAEIPIVALTASHTPETEDQARQAGMNDISSKPFRPNDLAEKLVQACRQREPEITA